MNKRMMRIWTLVVTLSIVFYTGMVSAHGKVSLESDVCVRNMAGSMVHLSTYQPQHDPEAEYCTEIPQVGETFWVVDLVDEALRNMPIAVQIVRGSGENISETVTSLYSTNHSDGVIKGEFNLDEGDYTMLITGEGVPPLRYEYPLRIQMVNYADVMRTAVPYMIVILLLALFTNQFMKWRRAQQS